MKRRMALNYLADDKEREAAYARGKLRLMRKATELAVQCNAQVALVMFDAGGRLTQFSTSDMDQLLEHYGAAVLEPHERYTPQDVLYGSVYANGFGVGPAAQAAAAARSAQGAGAVGPSPVESPSGTSEACQAGVGTQHLLQPLGLAIDAASFPPVSPRSETAYNAIASEFERMLATMTQQQMEQQQHLQQLQRQQQREQQRQQREQAQQQEQSDQGVKGEGEAEEAAAGAGTSGGDAGAPATTPSSSMPPPAARRPQAGVAAAPAGVELDSVDGAAAAGDGEPGTSAGHAAADVEMGPACQAADGVGMSVSDAAAAVAAAAEAAATEAGAAGPSGHAVGRDAGAEAAREGHMDSPQAMAGAAAADGTGAKPGRGLTGSKRRKRSSDAGSAGDLPA